MPSALGLVRIVAFLIFGFLCKFPGTQFRRDLVFRSGGVGELPLQVTRRV